MKKTLLFFTLVLSSVVIFAQVSAGQVDTFEESSTQSWAVGGAASSQISNVATGGPTGDDDGFLQYFTSGSPNGAGSKMIVFNRGQWTGNYTSEGIVEIQFDAKVEGSNNLEIRFALSDETGAGTGSGTRMSSSSSVIVAAGSGWNSYTIPISSSNFTIVEGSGTAADVLVNVAEARFLHATSPDWFGGVISGTLQLDNITASTTLNRKDFDNKTEFTIYPNPSRSNLNITLPNFENNAKVEVYNILGARVYKSELNKLNTSIDVSKWNSGVYLVRVSSDIETVTKRFVKQ